MTHLLAIAVGPVQEFIAAARRTRDLWFGSHLLSEISRAAAAAVQAHGGRLIFPARLDADSVANVVLAELPAGDPKAVAAAARAAAQGHWLQFAAEARREGGQAIRPNVWDEQVGDVLEFYAAWVPAAGRYPQERATLMRLLAGRKNCRDFRPAAGHAGLPKSSLDGLRETILYPPAQWPKRFRARLRVREGEQLDVVGLVKRVGLGHQPYPSVSRVAADPWVRGNLHRISPVVSACEQLQTDGVIRRLDTRAHPKFAAFPYEGTAVYPSRHHELAEETEVKEERLAALRQALAKLPEPSPYLAVVVADGDKMGAAIAALTSADSNRAFSNALADFATGARTIVAGHSGVPVYAGGDDVLAFLPVDKCLECARQLHDAFGACLADHGRPTLSVGIAIGHFMDDLEELLDYGRAAEKAAKRPDRDGLAVHLHKRGGSPVQVRSPWADGPDKRLTRHAELIQAEAIPGKLPYDLRPLADLYRGWPPDRLAQVLSRDVLRVIRDKQPRAGRAYLREIEALLSERLTDTTSLSHFANELLVARQLATARQQAGRRPALAREAVS